MTENTFKMETPQQVRGNVLFMYFAGLVPASPLKFFALLMVAHSLELKILVLNN